MNNEMIKSALEEIGKYCSGNWAVTGSTNLFLRGLEITPNDVDIFLTRDSAMELTSLAPFMAGGIFEDSFQPTIKSFFHKAEVANVVVEFMADARVKAAKDEWVALDSWQDNVELVSFEGITVPVTSLAFEKAVFEILGNIERIKLIETINDNV